MMSTQPNVLTNVVELTSLPAGDYIFVAAADLVNEQLAPNSPARSWRRTPLLVARTAKWATAQATTSSRRSPQQAQPMRRRLSASPTSAPRARATHRYRLPNTQAWSRFASARCTRSSADAGVRPAGVLYAYRGEGVQATEVAQRLTVGHGQQLERRRRNGQRGVRRERGTLRGWQYCARRCSR